MRYGITCMTWMAWSLLSTMASAQQAPAAGPPPPTVPETFQPRPVTVTLHGTRPGVEYRLYAMDAEQPLAVCGEGCRVQLPQGQYRLQVAGTPGSDVRTSDTPIELFSDTDVRVDPPSSSNRTTGLALGITGASLLVVGGVVLYVGIIIEMMRDFDDETACDLSYSTSTCRPPRHGPNVALWAGAGMLVAGAIMTPIGWVMFGRNHRARLEVTAPGRSSSEAGRWRVGPTRIGTGWGLGTSVGF